MSRYFPGAYSLLPGGADPVEPAWPFGASDR